jgi:hypothetical protein
MKIRRSMANPILTKEQIQKLLKRKVDNHNKRFEFISGKKADYWTLKIVFSRGYEAEEMFGSEEENHKIKAGFRRVKEFLYLLRNGYPAMSSDIALEEDFHILPKGHRMHAKWETFHRPAFDYFAESETTFSNYMQIFEEE